MQELEAAKKASRAPIAFSSRSHPAQPAAAPQGGVAATAGAVRGSRPGALTVKEKEEKSQLQADLAKAKEELQV